MRLHRSPVCPQEGPETPPALVHTQRAMGSPPNQHYLFVASFTHCDLQQGGNEADVAVPHAAVLAVGAVWVTTDATSCMLSFSLGAYPSRCKVWHTSGDLLASVVRLAGIGPKVEALAEAVECNTPTPTTVKNLRAAR